MIIAVILPHVFFWFSENRESDFFPRGEGEDKKIVYWSQKPYLLWKSQMFAWSKYVKICNLL